MIRLYESVPSPDWVDICQCLMFLDDAPEVARILNRLLQGEVRAVALCIQFCTCERAKYKQKTVSLLLRVLSLH